MISLPAASHAVEARRSRDGWMRRDKEAAGRRKSLRQPVEKKKEKVEKEKKKKKQRGVTLCQTEGGRARLCADKAGLALVGVYCHH